MKNVRVLPTGEVAGIMRMAFTYGLFVGLTKDPWNSYRTRFCFESRQEAVDALKDWDGHGFPPGYWVKQKPEDISNPLRDNGI